METRLCANKMEWVQIQLGFDHMFVVDCVGRSGGLALFWTNDSRVDIQNYSRRHINAKVCLSPTDPPWKFTSFYGHSDPSKHSEACSLLHYIVAMDKGL
jgi:hypothetical protein